MVKHPLLVGILALAAHAADTVLSTCDLPGEWTGGTIDTVVRQAGTGSVRWGHGDSPQLRFTAVGSDLSTHRSISFWMHSNVANGQKFMLIVQSENPDSAGTDYFSRSLTADFTGWRQIELKRSTFSSARNPLGWDKVTGLYFTASGWGNTPNPANIIHIDDLRLSGVEPTSTGILRALKPGHPRLIVPAGGFPAVKARMESDSTTLAWFARIRRSADGLLTAAPSVYELPDGKRLLSVSRAVLDRVYKLAFVFRMTSDTAYLTRAWEEMAAAAAFPDWNPSHFLDVAEMTHALGIGYDWLYDALGQSRRDSILHAIVRHGLTPYTTALADNAWWLNSAFNWNTVCNGGIGMGALAVAEHDTTLTAEIVMRSVLSMKDAGSVAMFGPDGGWPEGPGYWSYATKYLFLYVAALETAIDSTHELLDIAGVAETGGFPIYVSGAANRMFNYADCGEGITRAPWLFWLAARFGNPLYSWQQRRLAAPDVLDIVWYDSDGRSPTDLAIPLDKHFRGVEVATFRSSWENPDMLFVGTKAGNNDVGHAHLDLGTFVFDALGERWAGDLGGDDYNMPGYFGTDGWDGDRWKYYRLRTEGHNALLINPSARGGQDPFAETKIDRFGDAVDGDPFAIMDLTDAYDEFGATSVRRGVALVNGRTQAVVQDEIVTAQPSDIWWFLHTKADATVAADGRSAVLTKNNKRVAIRLLAPATGMLVLRDAAPLATSPNPAVQAVNGTKLAIHTNGTTNLTITVLFTPLQPGQNPDTVALPVLRSLDEPQWPVSTQQAVGSHATRHARQPVLLCPPAHRRSTGLPIRFRVVGGEGVNSEILVYDMKGIRVASAALCREGDAWWNPARTNTPAGYYVAVVTTPGRSSRPTSPRGIALQP